MRYGRRGHRAHGSRVKPATGAPGSRLPFYRTKSIGRSEAARGRVRTRVLAIRLVMVRTGTQRSRERPMAGFDSSARSGCPSIRWTEPVARIPRKNANLLISR